MTKEITHHEFFVSSEYMEIKKVSDHLLKQEITYLKDAKIYDYKGERIVENLYVKGLWRYTSEYRALVKELKLRERDNE